jgi:Lytic transglycolase
LLVSGPPKVMEGRIRPNHHEVSVVGSGDHRTRREKSLSTQQKSRLADFAGSLALFPQRSAFSGRPADASAKKSKGIAMRPLFTASLAAAALLGLGSLPAEAAVDREARFSGSRFAEDGSARLQFARTTVDDGDRIGPRRRTYERWERPRRVKSHQARPVKWARGHARRHTLRQHQRVVRGPARFTRARAVPAGPSGSDLVGVASYYGGQFHGRLTASGARFDMNSMTAAHRSLPFGTRVRVTHLGNGRSVEVRITDRGPFVGGRIIDLSRGAAGVIGMQGQGVARVKVTVLGR